MTRTKPRLSKQKSNRSRTKRAKKIKQSWINRKSPQEAVIIENGSDMMTNDEASNNMMDTFLLEQQQVEFPELNIAQGNNAFVGDELNASELRDTFGKSHSPVSLQNLEDFWVSDNEAEVNEVSDNDTGENDRSTCNSKQHEEAVIDLDMAWGSNEEFDQIMAEELSIEVEPPEECIISGNRIVEIGYLLQRTIRLAEDHARTCTSGRLIIHKEKRSGLASTIFYKCNLCEKTMSCSTEDSQKPKSVINTAAVWGSFATGSTYKHTEEFLSSLNIPSISNTMYYTIQDDLRKVWLESLYSNMEKAGKEEHTLAIQQGHVDADGIPWICVYLDGGWSKRSYGHNYNAASGVAVIIGRATKKVLYLGVRNKFCIICARADNKNVEPKTHTCFKNWTGSSSAMEANIIVEGFSSSIEMHGLRYKQFVADGDSSVYIHIQQKVSYGKEVVKIECSNHVIKNYGKRLYAIKNDTRNVSFAARQLLPYKKIVELQKIAQKAIYDNAHGDVAALKRDLENGPCHVFQHHVDCADYYCETVGETSTSQLNAVRSSGLLKLIQGALSLVVRKGPLLIDNETNNRAEVFMSILARFNMGKRLNLIQRSSFQSRSHLTALRYNEGFLWHSSPWKKAVKQSPGKYFKKFMNSQTKYKRKLKFHSRQQKKSKLASKTPRNTTPRNTDYGPLALQPELTGEEFEQECMRKLNNLQVTEDRCNEIAENTVGQFDCPLYRLERCERLTASNFGNVVKRRDYTSCHCLVKSILTPQNFTSAAIEYGKMNEAIAISSLEEVLGVKVVQSGLFIDVDHPFLGASPDGLIGDNAVVEVKCLFKVAKLGISLEEAVKTIPSLCLEFKNNALSLKKNHNYYYQIQGQLNICKRQLCYFVIFVNEKTPLYIEKIERDANFWDHEMLNKLIRFYRQCILPELVRGNLKRGLRCVDPIYIIEAQEKQKEGKQQRD